MSGGVAAVVDLTEGAEGDEELEEAGGDSGNTSLNAELEKAKCHHRICVLSHIFHFNKSF